MYSLDEIRNVDPEIAECICQEVERQNSHIELIASENWVSKAVMAAMGSPLTNKYAEGYPGKRYYGGCECVDDVERLAIERAKELFQCEYVNVQPHSGAQANMAVFFAMLKPGDTVMGMNLAHGGHLSHGSPANFSGAYFKVVPYGVNDDGVIDYDEVRRIALEAKPKLIVAGASAYCRIIDFKKFREIADEAGAYLMVDIAHIAGLVAAGVHPSPIPYAHVTTTTTHKTLRGPRGGMIMSSAEVAKKFNFNKAVFPGTQGGPLIIFEWWDRLLDPVLEYVGQEKGLAREVSTNTLDLLAIDKYDESSNSSEASLAPFTERLLSRWMDARASQINCVPTADFKDRMVKKALMVFGKKDPKVRISPSPCACCS